MKVSVIGTGYVGLVTGACLAEMGNDVLCLDVDPNKIRILEEGGIPIHEPGLDAVVARNVKAGRLAFTTDIARSVAHGTLQFIAVGTPPDEDGSADLQYVLAAARNIGRLMSDYKVVVDKSTVPVGTADKVRAAIAEELARRGSDARFAVVSNPEFLKEGAAVDDFMRPDRIIVGADDEQAILLMRALDDVPPEHANRLKDEIQQDINELNGLVEEVLLASRLDARPTLDLQPVDVLGLLIEEAGRVGAEVDTEHLPPDLAGTPLRAARRNLLENARRYGRTGPEPAAIEARLRISAAQRLEILIEDRGPGVPPDQRERIFEPFYRMPGHAEHAGGVGLGLSLVAQIAQRHGGEVRCEAREGGGSRFVIALPMPSEPHGREASRRGAQARK